MRPLYIFAITLLALTSTSFAQEKDALSLQQALEIAHDNNPRVLEARQNVLAAKGHWENVRIFSNPELELEATELSQAVHSGSTVGEDSISIRQEVDVLGKSWLRSKTAKAEYEAVKLSLHQTWNEVATDVTENYNHLLLSTQRISVAHEVLELARRFLDQVQLRYNAGEVLRNELLRAQIEVAKAENNVLEAQKQADLDRAELNVALGRDAQVQTVASDDLKYEDRDFDANRLLEQALLRRPDLQASRMLLEASRQKLQLATRDVFENPTLSAKFTRGEERKVFGMTISVPFPFWNWNQGAIKEAKAEVATEEIKQKALEREVGLDVERALTQARLAKRQVNMWKSAVDQADELMRLATLQYQGADINFITYLEHLATVRETKLTYIEALANYRTQLAQLDLAVANTVLPSST